jgi:hypothetical protein
MFSRTFSPSPQTAAPVDDPFEREADRVAERANGLAPALYDPL